jgi:hypothetical protein
MKISSAGLLMTAVVFLCAGCRSLDVTGHQPYARYSGVRQEIQRDMSLDLVNEPDILGFPHKAYILSETSIRAFAGNFAKYYLPAGTPITISRVRHQMEPFAGRTITVRGRVYVPELKKEVPYKYYWESTAQGIVMRAPWEKPDAGDDRYVDKRGRLKG